MKTILGNFARVAQDKGKFPMDANTLEKLQENTALLAVLGAALGKRAVILTGCEKNGNRRTEGYVYVKLTDTGEVLYFPGGDYTESFCHINAKDSDVTAKGEPYEDAYTTRTLENGRHPYDATQTLEWGEFVVGSEIYALKTELKQAIAAPAVAFMPGMVMMWNGAIEDIPRGWHLCDGTHGTEDLRDLFIVGAGRQYAVGASGGKNFVSLTKEQMPSHSHTGTTGDGLTNLPDLHEPLNTTGNPDGSKDSGTGSNDQNGHQAYWRGNDEIARFRHSHSFTTNSAGGGQSHENRPPFYALAYIQYIGEDDG